MMDFILNDRAGISLTVGVKSLTCNLLSSIPWFVHHDPNAILLYSKHHLTSQHDFPIASVS